MHCIVPMAYTLVLSTNSGTITAVDTYTAETIDPCHIHRLPWWSKLSCLIEEDKGDFSPLIVTGNLWCVFLRRQFRQTIPRCGRLFMGRCIARLAQANGKRQRKMGAEVERERALLHYWRAACLCRLTWTRVLKATGTKHISAHEGNELQDKVSLGMVGCYCCSADGSSQTQTPDCISEARLS